MLPITLIPFKSLGPFHFDSMYADYESKYEFEYVPADEEDEWDTYMCEEPAMEIYVDEGVVVAASCWESCIYMGKELIGMEIPAFEKFAGCKFDHKEKVDLGAEEGGIHTIYEFDDLGLQLWVREGEIVSVFAGPSLEEEDEDDDDL